MLNDEQLDHAFRTVMASARRSFDGTNDEFDWQLATRARNGVFSGDTADAWMEIDNALYRVANGELREALTQPGDPTVRVDGLNGGSMKGWPDFICKNRLRELLTPRIDALVAECKSYKYTGWSRESRGPIRKVS